jgi:exonuclease SbcC
MVPYELVLQNFMCYRGEFPPLKFDGLHVTCLSGENGAGKSALLDAITWALWGKARMSDDELIAQNEREMVVELTFLLNNQLYRVSRRRHMSKSGKRSSSRGGLDLLVKDENGWRPIGAATITETERVIEQLLRMKYDTFINASFLVQGRADEFTRKTPGERKQVLADILDLRDYAMLEERAKKRTKELVGQVQTLDGMIAHLQQEADKLSLYEQFVQEAEQKAEMLRNELATGEQEKETADEKVRLLETKLARRKEIQERLNTLQQDIRQQEQEIADLRAAIAEAEALLQRRETIAQGVADLADAREALAKLDELRPRYDELFEQRRQHQDALKDTLRGLQSELEGWKRELQRLEQQVAQRPAIQAKLAEQEEQLATLAPLAEELANVREQRATLDERISQVYTLSQRQSELVTTIQQHYEALLHEQKQQEREIARLDKQLENVQRWRTELETALAQQQQMQALSQELATMRQQEQEMGEQVGSLRAACTQYKQQADEIKKRQALLTDEQQHRTTCPLCNSELGPDGITTIADHYEQEILDLRQQYKNAKKEADDQEKELKQLRETIRQQEAQLGEVQQGAARVETLQQQLAQAESWQQEHAQAAADRDRVTQQLETGVYAQEEREALLTVEAELAAAGADREQPQAKKGKRKTADSEQAPVYARWSSKSMERERKTVQQRQNDLEKQLEARSTMESEAANLRYRLDEIEQVANQVPQTQSQIAALEKTIADSDYGHDIRADGRAVEAQIAELGYSKEAHEAARQRVQHLAHWTDEEHRLSVAESTLERDRRALQRTEELLARYSADKEQLLHEDGALEQEVRAFPAAQQHARQCAEQVTKHRHDLDVAKHDLSEKQTLYKKAQDAAEQLAQRQSERETLVERQSVFQELAEAFGKKGVQAMLIETAIPEIERESNRLLNRITDNQMHVTFDMQRSTKKGDTVETLDIKISDALGTRSYDAFSGGETMRINFAIRVALSRLLARRAGASLETLVIDEGFGALDADGRERFVEAITSVQNDFKRILVVTHIDDLKDRFPTQIQITKRREGSVWELL